MPLIDWRIFQDIFFVTALVILVQLDKAHSNLHAFQENYNHNVQFM